MKGFSMRLWRRSHSRLDQALDMLARRNAAMRDLLKRSVDEPFTTQDVAAALLGNDLWFKPLREYRDYLRTVPHRPHLWGFMFNRSAEWPSSTWKALPLETRQARARIASVAHEFDFTFAPSALGLRPRDVGVALRDLHAHGLATPIRNGLYRVYAVATPGALETDLYLVEIIAHWLGMLHHADRIASNSTSNGYEVHGYEEACPMCRNAWGLRPRSPEWIPPFHPGCRCFAQPRFTSRNGPIIMEAQR